VGTFSDEINKGNTFGIEFGSATKDGGPYSTFRNNCLRVNRWGLANQRHRLADALITGNKSYRIGVRRGEIGRTYEIGWAYQWPEW